MRYILLLAFVACLLSCKSNKNNNQVVADYNGKYPRVDKLFAVYLDTSGFKIPGLVLRRIDKTVKWDSIQKKDIVITDTLWGVQRVFYPKDTTKKPSLEWFQIGKDSVNTHVENINVDSLLKK